MVPCVNCIEVVLCIFLIKYFTYIYIFMSLKYLQLFAAMYVYKMYKCICLSIRLQPANCNYNQNGNIENNKITLLCNNLRRFEILLLRNITFLFSVVSISWNERLKGSLLYLIHNKLTWFTMITKLWQLSSPFQQKSCELWLNLKLFKQSYKNNC